MMNPCFFGQGFNVEITPPIDGVIFFKSYEVVTTASSPGGSIPAYTDIIKMSGNGNRLIMGNPNQVSGGAVHIFEIDRNSGKWNEVYFIQNDRTADVTSWGSAVAIDGDGDVIGGYSSDDNATLYYRENGGIWTQQGRHDYHYLSSAFGDITKGLAIDNSGANVYLCGSNLLWPNPIPENPSRDNAGAILASEIPVNDVTLTDTDATFSSNPTEGANYGAGIDLSGSTYVTGSKENDTYYLHIGKGAGEKKISLGLNNYDKKISGGTVIASNSVLQEVNVYRYNPASDEYDILFKLISPDAAPQGFGNAADVAKGGEIIAVADDQYSSDSGRVYIFKWDGSNYIHSETLNGTRGAGEFFGSNLTLDDNGNRLAIANRESGNRLVYFYDFTAIPYNLSAIPNFIASEVGEPTSAEYIINGDGSHRIVEGNTITNLLPGWDSPLQGEAYIRCSGSVTDLDTVNGNEPNVWHKVKGIGEANEVKFVVSATNAGDDKFAQITLEIASDPVGADVQGTRGPINISANYSTLKAFNWSGIPSVILDNNPAGTAYSGYKIYMNTGDHQTRTSTGGGVDISPPWDSSPPTDDYFIRATIVSGSGFDAGFSDAVGVWLDTNAEANYAWFTRDTTTGTNEFDMFIEVATDSEGANIVSKSPTFTVRAQS